MKALEDRDYTFQEVKDIIQEQHNEFERFYAETKSKNELLSKENEDMKASLQSRIEKDKELYAKISSIMEGLKDYENQGKKKLEENLIRLKVTQSKLVAYFRMVQEKYPLDDYLLNSEEFLKRMDSILGTDYMNKSYEADMFKADNVSFIGASNVAKGEAYNPNESGFNLDEALNPTSDLESICKDLGLI